MQSEERRVMVGVFDLPERADRAVAELLAGGASDRQVDTVSGAADGVAESLTDTGVSGEQAAYYEDEVRAGRRLVVVRCDPGHTVAVMTAFGRHGGSVRVPAMARGA